MKKFTRRFSAVVLSAALALASPCALANEYSAAQVMITAQDGSQQALHVQMAVTSSGDTVYWMDLSQLTDEQIMALEMGLLVVTDESGAVIMQIPLQGANILDSNGLVELAHPEDPEITYPLVLGQMPMPEDAAEVEGIVEAYMFDNEDAYDDESYDEESYDEESYDEETYDEESYDEETYDEEPYVEETYDEESYDEESYDEESYDEESYDEESYDEETARIEAEQEAARRAAEEEAARKAAEEAARIAAESQNGDETADNAQDETVNAFTVPQYVIPNRDATNLRSETSTASDDTVLTQVNTNDVLNVYGYVHDADGNVWWQVEDYRTGYVGYILSSVVGEADEYTAVSMMEAIEAEEYEEEEPEVTEPEITEPEVTEPEEIEPEADEPETEEPEETEQDEPAEIVEPEYVTPNRNATNLRSETSTASDASVLTQVNEGDILAVFDYVYDDEGNVWWQVEDYRTGYAGYIMASVVSEVPADQMSAYIAAIDAQEAAEEPEITEPETEEPEVTEPEETEPEIVEPETEEPEVTEPEETEPEIVEPEITEPEVTEPETEEDVEEDVEEDAEPEEDESESAQPEADVNYGQTNNKNSDESNLRAEPSSKGAVVGKYKNGELLIVGEPSNDGKWYPVTVVSDGNQGYMRDYIIGAISKVEAQERMAEMLGDKVIASQQPQEEEEDSSDETVETAPPADVWEDEADTADDVQDIETDDVQDADDAGDDWQDEEPAEDSEEADHAPASKYPLYAMTLDQDNKAVIVLVEAPGALPPQMGNIDPITGPTPLEILSEKMDDAGVLWYEVRNMSTDTTGYVEAFKVELVDKAVAQENVKTPAADLIKPIPPQNEEEQEKEPEVTPEPTPEPTPTPEPDIPQELTQGDVYHYGRNTGRQVALREKPNSNGKLHYRMEKGTVLWVMKTEGEWCYVRTDKGEGYVKAEFVELMDVREEEEYRATLDDPEIVPEKPAEDEAQADSDAAENQPTPEPDVQEPVDTTPKELDVYTRVLSDMTPLRSNPGENAQMQTMLSADTVLYAVQSKANEDGTVWYLVRDEEMWGYVLEEQVAVMDEKETADYLAALEAAMATPTPTVEPTATPEPTTTPAPQRLGIYARVISDGTPLRGNPDPNAYLQNVLDEETVVYIFQSQIAADGMTWYLVQFSGQWGYIRADLVRPMGEQETADYLAQLEAELATPTPMPQVTPEPIGPDSTSAYAKLIKDAVNLRLTPSASGTSLGRIPVDTLLLVTGAQDDGAYTWYQVNYNGKDGFVRSDMAQMLTISQLQEYLAEQVNATPKPGAAVTPNKNNNTSITINGTELKDLIPVEDSWTNNVISGMPDYATASPDPNTTPSPVPPANPAALIGSNGNISVSHVPSLTTDGMFTVYGRTKPYSTVTATVEVEAQSTGTQQTFGFEFVSRAIAEAMVKRTVGQAIAGADGQFTMSVKLPAPGGYIVEFATAQGDYARYGVTYDNGATPEPTIAPLPTVAPVQEDNGMGILPFVIGGLLIVIAAAAYGVYVYRRKAEEEEEDEEDEDEETELREEQLSYQRQRRAESSAQAMPPRMTKPQAPSYVKNTRMEGEKREVSPYARPAAPQAPARPQAPMRPQAPTAPQAPTRPQAPAAPQAPVRPQAPAAPQAPTVPQVPVAPQAPVTPADTAAQDGAPRRRRRPPTDMNA